MITHKGKENSENLSANSHQGPWAWAYPGPGAPIPLVHGTALLLTVLRAAKYRSFRISGRARLGDMALTFMSAGAHFEEVRTGKLHNLAHGAELPEVSNFSDQTGCRDLADPLERKEYVAVGNLGKMRYHLLLRLSVNLSEASIKERSSCISITMLAWPSAMPTDDFAPS